MQVSSNTAGNSAQDVARAIDRQDEITRAPKNSLTYPRTFSEYGLHETQIWRMLEFLIQSNRCQVTSGQAFARPVTCTHPLAAEIVHELSTRLKPNLPLTFAYEGVWDLIEAAGDAILGLGNHPEPSKGAMVVMKSATQSLQQSLHLYRTLYYAQHGVKLNEVGLAGAAASGVPRPAVLAAVNSNLMLSKASGLLGFGKEDIFLYGLNEDFQGDEDSLCSAIDRAHASGRRIVSHLIIAGDAERGVVHDARRLDAITSDRCAPLGYRPPVIVDAAAQWLNLLMSEQSAKWDLRAENDNIKAVIFDPQKTELPYDLSLLLLRDYQDLKSLIDPEHNGHPDKRFLLAQANNILSRGGEAIVAAYFYILNQGLDGLRQSRAEILYQSRRLAKFIESDSRFELIVSPQSSVVSWTLRDPHPLANWEFAQKINSQEKDRFLLTYNHQSRVRTPEQLERSLRGDRSFDGIVAHFMEHNTGETVDALIERLKNI